MGTGSRRVGLFGNLTHPAWPWLWWFDSPQWLRFSAFLRWEKTQYSTLDVRAGTKTMSMVSISADEQWLQRLDCNAWTATLAAGIDVRS